MSLRLATCKSTSAMPEKRKRVSFVDWLDYLFVYHGYAETLLLVINFLLVVKTSVNLLAVYNDTRSLILDYNGTMLFNPQFKLCFIGMNLALILSSTLCLLGLLLVSPKSSPKSAKLRVKLTKYFAITQLLLAVITLLLMGKLWFSPPTLNLDADESVANEIIAYTYYFGPDSSGVYPSPPRDPMQMKGNRLLGSSPLVSYDEYKYTGALDRLQQALGCCGIWSSEDWRRLNERAGLLAPSCCLKPRGPMRLMVPADKRFQSMLVGSGEGFGSSDSSSSLNSNSSSDRNITTDLDMFYCIEPTNDVGCQRLISENELTFVFRLRIVLLLLLALLFINMITLASIDNPHSQSRLMPAGSGSQEVQQQQQQPPPPYEVALGPPRYVHSTTSGVRTLDDPRDQMRDQTMLTPSYRDICLVRTVRGFSSAGSTPVHAGDLCRPTAGAGLEPATDSSDDNDDQGQRKPRAVSQHSRHADHDVESAICVERNNTVITML